MDPLKYLHRSLTCLVVVLVLSLPVPTAAAQEGLPLPGQFAYVEGGSRLYLVRGNVEQPALLVQVEGGLVVENPHFSQDGRYLAYCIHDPQLEDYPRLYYLDTRTLEKVEVTTEGSCSYDWWQDGKTLVFSTVVFLEKEMHPDQGIWSFSPATGALEVLMRTGVPVIDPRWSADGRTLSYFDYCFECVGQFHTYDLISGVTMDWSQEGTGRAVGPDVDWSPDGKWLAFDQALWMYSEPGGTHGLELASSDAEAWQEVHSQPGRGAFFPLWSPDGKRIAFASFESFTIGNYVNRRADLMTVQPDGSNTKIIYSSIYEVFPQAWSPDGRYMLLVEPLSVNQDSAQKQQLVLLDMETGGPLWKISSTGVLTADWAPLPMEEAVPGTVTPMPGTAPTEAAGVPNDLQNEAPLVNDPVTLFAVLLWGVALIAIAVLLLHLWRHPPSLRKEPLRGVQEPVIDEKPVQGAEPAATPTPEDTQAAFQQGVDLVHAGQVEQGIAALSRVISAEPENSVAWFWLGIASARQKDERTAERCFLLARRYGHPEAGKALEWLKKKKTG